MQEYNKDGEQFADERDELLEQDATEQEGESSGGRRGFAGMSEEKRKAIASKGGQSQGKHNNSGNFANDREKAVAAGRLGGQHSRGGGRTDNEGTEE